MDRNWTKVGEEHTKGKQDQIAKIIERMQWQPIPCEMGIMPGEGIKAAIKQLRIPKVTRVAVSSEMAPYGFLGIEGNYTNGRARICLVDEGIGVTPIVTDLYPNMITTIDGPTKVEWWDKERFTGRTNHIITGHSDDDVCHDVIPVPDDCIICDFCNDDITEFPCPVVWGTHTLCMPCYRKIKKGD